jgi:hypothetical protein
MHHQLMGRAHAAVYTSMLRARGALAREGGQGTVEYVGLILLIAVVLAGVVKAGQGFSDDKSIATEIVKKLKGAIVDVGRE